MKLRRVLSGVFAALLGIDYSMTYFAVSSGIAVEANPHMQHVFTTSPDILHVVAAYICAVTVVSLVATLLGKLGSLAGMRSLPDPGTVFLTVLNLLEGLTIANNIIVVATCTNSPLAPLLLSLLNNF